MTVSSVPFSNIKKISFHFKEDENKANENPYGMVMNKSLWIWGLSRINFDGRFFLSSFLIFPL